MKELESNVGKTEAYYRMADNLEQIEALLKKDTSAEEKTQAEKEETQIEKKETKAAVKVEEIPDIKNGMELCRL